MIEVRKAGKTERMRGSIDAIFWVSSLLFLAACSSVPPPVTPVVRPSTQALTHAPLPRIELRTFSLEGSREITVTSDGLLTYKRSINQIEPLHTMQLTDAQIDEIADAANVALETRSRPDHVTDYRIFHRIGNQSFDDDGPNPRFAQLNECLWRLIAPYEPKDQD